MNPSEEKISTLMKMCNQFLKNEDTGIHKKLKLMVVLFTVVNKCLVPQA
jgi:hypothetical protein